MKSLSAHRARVVQLGGFVLFSVFAAGSAQAAPIPFSPAQFAPAGERPFNMLIQDLNADNRPDIVVTNSANESSVRISVLMNRGDASFDPPVSYLQGTFARTLAAGDLDDDGDVDLGVGLFNGPNLLAVLKNTGDGTFDAPVLVGAGSGDYRPDAAHAGDIDDDGDIDIVLCLAGLGVAAVCRNPGDGTLSVTDLYFSENPAYTSDLAVADFDGDQDPDLATVRALSFDPPSILRNRGDGTFDPPAPFYSQGFEHLAIAAGDVDRDDDQDLVLVAEGNRIHVFLNDGAGTLAYSAWYPLEALTDLSSRIILADLDGDGAPEVIFPSRIERNVRVLRNDGAGVFAAPDEYAAATEPVMPRAADLDGDGDRDVVVTGFTTEQVVMFWNRLSDLTGAPAGVAGGASILSARPNPLRHGATISYQLAESGPARLALYDASGRLVRVLVDRIESAGPHHVTWSGRGEAGERLASGRYVLSLEGRAVGTMPLILLR